jgi:outer membrane protein
MAVNNKRDSMKKSFLSLLFIVLFPSSAAVAEDLLQVYRLAQDNDAQLRQAGAVRDAVYESRPQALARLFPTLSASSEKRWLHVNPQNSSRDLNSSNPERFNLSLDLSQPIYRRDYWIQLEQADLQIAQAEAEYAAQEQELIIRTAEAYFDILSAKDELEFARAENESIGRQLEQSKQRFEVGLIAITDVYESKAAFDQSRADLIVAENNVFQAWQVLYEIILENVEEIVPLAEELPLDPPDPQDIEAWSETALQQNLSIQAAEYGKNIAQQEIDVQRSGHFPTLDLVGSHSVDRGSKSEALEADTSQIGVQLNFPLYTGGAVSSRTRQAQHDYQAALAELDRQRRAVRRQVRDAYQGVMDTITAVQAFQAGVVSSESSLEATRAGFDVGTRTAIDVLGAERDLFLARSNYSASRYAYIIQGLRLKQAAGSISRQDLEYVNSLLE